MARLARVVVPGVPHHVTQRGNGRGRTFFGDDDYAFYRHLLGRHCHEAGVEVWAWVLMPNHVHLILTPSDPDGLRRALAAVHRRYAGRIHARRKRTGHFWQGRFGCVAMDEEHLATALRYVALNPVRARLVKNALDWPWSSVRAHVTGVDDGVTTRSAALDRISRFAEFLEEERPDARYTSLRRAESIGRPLGGPAFLEALEAQTGRRLRPRKRGPKTADGERGEE
jgi:putative transposase